MVNSDVKKAAVYLQLNGGGASYVQQSGVLVLQSNVHCPITANIISYNNVSLITDDIN